jgi:DNA-directed RNA polymerase subunit beta
MAKEIRRFGKIEEIIPLPKLVELQIGSFDHFLQKGKTAPERGDDVGLQGAFKEIFPIDESDRNKTGGLVLDFLEYEIGEPGRGPEECREKDLTYQAPLYAKLQLIHRDTGLIKEDKVFLGDLPLMTEEGSFIVNGADRVIVSQIHRSPGVYFTADRTRVHRRRRVGNEGQQAQIPGHDALARARHDGRSDSRTLQRVRRCPRANICR